MNKERLMKVLLAPMRTEKTHRIADDNNQITFKVLADASKREIQAAVEMLFDVNVVGVQVVNVRGKYVRHGRLEGYKKNWRKAYVRLAPGQDIDFAVGDTA